MVCKPDIQASVKPQSEALLTCAAAGAAAPSAAAAARSNCCASRCAALRIAANDRL